MSTYCQNLTQTTKFKPNQTLFRSDIIFYQKILKYFNDLQNQNFSVLLLMIMIMIIYCQIMAIKQKKTFFSWDIFKSDSISFFYQKILKYFNDFQNRNFSVLCLKLFQTMKMKQNHTFLHGTYSNLTTFFFLSKNFKVFP